MHEISIFIFRRDLRLIDNIGLIEASINSKKVLPLFILTPEQVSNKNKYKSSNAIQFMMESLYDLDNQIRKIDNKCQLWITYGNEIDVLEKIISNIDINAIYVNEDYTHYSIKRDNKILNFCDRNNLEFVQCTDLLLIGTHDISAKNGNRYHNFSFFYKNVKSIPISKPKLKFSVDFLKAQHFSKNWLINILDGYLLDQNFYQINHNLAEIGGRKCGLNILKKIKRFKKYNKTRDILHLSTTMLSAHNKFGTVSIREVYYAFLTLKNDLIKQLYWRDFYYYVSIYFDTFYTYDHIYRSYNPKSKWENNSDYFDAWKKGLTGFPIVDAAMKQLNKTGYMHNRGRLITASFLCKDLLIDWKYGERYFGKKLVDIDRAQNLGNWNWSASYGLDSTSFIRILNPWTQSKKFDPNCEYIKYWLPQLTDVPNSHLHNWNLYYDQYDIDYPSPIVDHTVQSKKFKKFYKNTFSLK